MLSQLVYVSDRSPSSSPMDIEDIKKACKKNNPEVDITGILLYSDTKFIQLMEGEMLEVKDLYDKIKTDPRHTNVKLISLKTIKKKAVPELAYGNEKVRSRPDCLRY